MLLGALGIYASIQLGTLEWVEGLRGDLAAWALVTFGLLYLAWGLRRAFRNKPHVHWHSHGDVQHSHAHTHAHDGEHEHSHTVDDIAGGRRPPLAWGIFIVFVLGPCETLIPILMYPAAKESVSGLVAVTGVFAVVTVLTMLLAVLLTVRGLQAVRLPSLERFSDAIAGGTITLCGLSIVLLGL
jgi:ABC-type nickel/cobalt efflux system permease component RcnA